MTNRREFIQSAAFAVALAQTVAVNARAAGELPWVLVDEQHAQSHEFAARLTAHGARMLVMPEGDVTAIWLEEIEPQWQRAPAVIAGLTRPSVLFVLEQLGWAHGMRVAFHAEHLLSRTGTHHQVLRRGDAITGLGSRELHLAGTAWPGSVATAVASWGTSPGGRAGPSSAGLAPILPVGSELLASWIIAPV